MKGSPIRPLAAAVLARGFRTQACASFAAGDFTRAAVLFRMAARTQALALTQW